MVDGGDMKVLTIKRLGASSGSHKYDVGYVERVVVMICLVWLL
jgi:hypothetical protein